MMMSVSSSAAVRNITGTFDTRRIFRQKSNPDPSGSDTSRITRSYFPSSHNSSASRAVRATSISYPCFLTAKESPLIRLKSSSSKKVVSFYHYSFSQYTIIFRGGRKQFLFQYNTERTVYPEILSEYTVPGESMLSYAFYLL